MTPTLMLPVVDHIRAVLETYPAFQGEAGTRDRRFLALCVDSLARGDEVSLQELRHEMRGLSHYFGSYCSPEDMQTLDMLLDKFYSLLVETLASMKKGT